MNSNDFSSILFSQQEYILISTERKTLTLHIWCVLSLVKTQDIEYVDDAELQIKFLFHLR